MVTSDRPRSPRAIDATERACRGRGRAMMQTIWRLPRIVLQAFVKAYRLLLSPWVGNQCRFEPTCSVYALQALETQGAMLGSALTLGRLLRCQPWCEGGHDPVPDLSGRLQATRQQQFTGLIARSTKKKSS